MKISQCQARIKTIPLFKDLDDEFIDSNCSGMEFIDIPKGDMLFQSGDTPDRLYILTKGRIKIYKYLQDGREQILYIYNQGDFIGGFNILKNEEYRYYGESLENSSVVTVNKEVFDKLIMTNKDILIRILEKAYDRIRWAEDLIDRLSSSNSDMKIAGLLLRLIQDFGEKQGDYTVLNLTINREEMGSFAGLTRETITRKLRQFKELGYIDFVGNKKIILKDIEALRGLL